MNISVLHILLALAVGFGATLVMDAWLVLRQRLFRTPALNYCFLGRWILHMPKGVFSHVNIADASKKPWECVLGRVAHYSIGAVLGVLMVLIVSPQWLQSPTIIPAVVWGIVTVGAPFFIMQPAFGFGVAASRLPNPRKARIQSLLTHAVYGVGLYLSAVLVRLLLTMN